MYNHGYELLRLTEEYNEKISQIVIKRECELTELSEAQLRERMKSTLDVMINSAKNSFWLKVFQHFAHYIISS